MNPDEEDGNIPIAALLDQAGRIGTDNIWIGVHEAFKASGLECISVYSVVTAADGKGTLYQSVLASVRGRADPTQNFQLDGQSTPYGELPEEPTL